MATLRPHRSITRTAWTVLTGAPCGGKTTAIRELAKRGFRTQPEQAREFIQSELSRGRTLQEIAKDPQGLADAIFDMNRDALRRLDPHEPVVLDRSLPDVLVFSTLDGVDTTRYADEASRYQFASAIVFDFISHRRDNTVYHSRAQIAAARVMCESVYTLVADRVHSAPEARGLDAFSLDKRISALERLIRGE